jgi:protein required for attachment to host cells
MKKVWVVVANSSQAKIYKVENGQVLVEHGIFFHDESRLPGRELVSDGYGRETNTMIYGSDTYQQKTPVKLKESLLFADVIAHFLEEGYNSGAYERIYIVSKPPFLGHLRQSFHPNVAKLVEAEIHKDLTQLRPEEVREYLPPVL